MEQKGQNMLDKYIKYSQARVDMFNAQEIPAANLAATKLYKINEELKKDINMGKLIIDALLDTKPQQPEAMLWILEVALPLGYRTNEVVSAVKKYLKIKI